MNEEVDFKTKMTGYTAEIGGGIATDFATSGLLTLGPWGAVGYGIVNFGQGAYTNYLVQKHLYGKENVKWGEVWASGGMSAIPFMNIGVGKGTAKVLGQANTVKRGLVGGVGFGVGGEQLRVGIDEKRPLTLSELSTSAAFGGIAGAGFAQINKSIKNRNFRKQYEADYLDDQGKFDLAKVQAKQQTILKDKPNLAALRGKLLNNADPNHGLPTHQNGEEIIWKNFIPKSVLKKEAEMKGFMRDMGLIDEVFDFHKWQTWSLKTIDHVDKHGVEKKLYPNRKSARDFIGWFEAEPKSLANYYSMSATNSKERQAILQFYAPMIQELGLKSKDFQLHHLVPLKASIPLYHGLKYGSEEWWKLTAYLLKNTIKAGDSAQNLKWVFGSRGVTKVQHKKSGGSYYMKTPHSVSHTFVEETFGPDGRKFFDDKMLKGFITNPESRWGAASTFVKKTRDSFDITNLAEEMLNTKWKNLDLDVADITRTLNKLDEDGYIASLPREFQVDEINRMISEIYMTGKNGEFYLRSIEAFEEQEALRNLAKSKKFKEAASGLANTNEYFSNIVDEADQYLEATRRTSKQFVKYNSFRDPNLYLDAVNFLEETSIKYPDGIQQELLEAEWGQEILIIKLMEIFFNKYGPK